jgi:hypothetical protein
MFLFQEKGIMNTVEKNAVKAIAKVSPWLAPLPSAYFVGRSAMVHLALPLPVAVIVAAIIETLGLSTVHTALWAYDWNAHKRKTDPGAPVPLSVALGGVYVMATLGLVVFLEVWPALATYAPAIFPALAVVGALNLALIARQELREAEVRAQKQELKAVRQAQRPASRQSSNLSKPNAYLDVMLDTRRAKRSARMDALVGFYQDNPTAGPSDAARSLGVSRQTVYTYLDELQRTGRLARDDGHVQVLLPITEPERR